MSYQLLSERSAVLQARYPIDDGPWEGSPFAWIRNKAAGTKNKIGRDFVVTLIEVVGLVVERSGLALTVNDKSLRVKIAMEGDEGTFMFEQIRNDNFDYLVCLGLSPDNVYAWLIPKEEMLVDGVVQERQGLTGQHADDGGPVDFWITDLVPAQPFQWLAPFGGSTNAFMQAVRQSL